MLYAVLSFELLGLGIMVVNAAHMKAVPGRKTDVKDAEWIADLLQHGLLRGSFIPSREQRELRELTRYRKSIIEERSRELNRLQKVLEGANIKLGSVLKDIQGKSARRLLDRLVSGEAMDDCAEISKLLHCSLLPKLDEIMVSLDGIITPLQRELLAQILDHIDDLDRRIHKLDQMTETYMVQSRPDREELCQMPGIGPRSAEVILAEIGTDMSRFPSEAHLSSWAGVCPGNHKSAGKRYHGRTRKGNHTLKSMLVQCAKSASRRKDSYFSAQYREHKIHSYLRRLQALGWEPDSSPAAI